MSFFYALRFGIAGLVAFYIPLGLGHEGVALGTHFSAKQCAPWVPMSTNLALFKMILLGT
jgi:hypothetical protein